MSDTHIIMCIWMCASFQIKIHFRPKHEWNCQEIFDECSKWLKSVGWPTIQEEELFVVIKLCNWGVHALGENHQSHFRRKKTKWYGSWNNMGWSFQTQTAVVNICRLYTITLSRYRTLLKSSKRTPQESNTNTLH